MSCTLLLKNLKMFYQRHLNSTTNIEYNVQKRGKKHILRQNLIIGKITNILWLEIR